MASSASRSSRGLMSAPPPPEEDFDQLASYTALGILLLSKITYIFERGSLSYLFSYRASAQMEGELKFFEVTSSYPELTASYGALIGPAYTIPFAVCSLLAAPLLASPKTSRPLLLGAAVFTASATFGVAGSVESYEVFAAMRAVQGAASSIVNPIAFSLVSDLFPAGRRASANSIISACNQAGEGFSSLSIVLISLYGWRNFYLLICLCGSFFALVTAIGIKDPERGRFDDLRTAPAIQPE